MPSTWPGSWRSTPRRASRSRRFTRRTSPATPGSTGRKSQLHHLHEDLPGADASPSETSPPRSGAGPCRRIRTTPTSPRRVAIDSAALQYVKGFGVQWNLQAAVATLAPKGARHADGAPVRQLQLRDARTGTRAGTTRASRRTITLYGEESWQLIRDWIVSGRELVQRLEHGARHRRQEPGQLAPERALVVDRSAKKLIVTAGLLRLPALLASTSPPGATRIGTQRQQPTRSPSRTPTAASSCEVYNKATSSKTMTVGVGSALSQTLYQFNVPAHGWATLRVPQ